MFRRSLLVGLIVLVCVACFCIAGRELYTWANPGYSPTEFSEASWATGTAEERGHMAKDLLRRHDLVGVNVDRVNELLGPPDEDQKGLRRYRYHLGNMGRNSEAPFFFGYSLLITFDNSGRVLEAVIAD